MRLSILLLLVGGCAASSRAPTARTPAAEMPGEHPQQANTPETDPGADRRKHESLEIANEAIEKANQGDLPAAEALLEKATRLDPDNHNAWFTMGRVLDQRQAHQPAVDAYREAVRIKRDDAEYQYFLGKSLWMLSATDNVAQAHDALAIAVQLNPKHHRAHYHLGLVFEMQSEPRKAAEALTTSIRLDPSFGRASSRLARLYLQWHKLDAAIAVLEHARLHVKDAELLVDIHYELGLAFGMQKRWPDAIFALSQALEIQSDNLDALLQRGFAYAEAGDRQHAKIDLETFLKKAAGGDAFALQAATQRLSSLPRRSKKPATETLSRRDDKARGAPALPAIPSFEVPAMIGDAHQVGEMLLRGDSHLGSELKVRGVVAWVYDCAESLRKAGMSRGEVKRLLREEPERCLRPHFNLADAMGAPDDQHLQVVDVPRGIRPDERRVLPPEMIKEWPAVPNIKVGDKVIITGTWAKRSPLGFHDSRGLLVYKTVEHLP